MPVQSPTDYTTEDIQKLNLMKERLSDLISAVMVELEMHKDTIDKVTVLQNMLLALANVQIPDVQLQPVFAEIKNDIERQIQEYLQRELEKKET